MYNNNFKEKIMKKENASKYAYPVIALGFALLFLVLLKLPYIEGVDGVYLLELYQTGFLGFVISFFHFFYIIGLLLLINISFLGFLKVKGVVEIKKSYKDWTYNKLVKTLILTITALSFVSLLFGIIFCIANSVYIGFGSILNSVLAILGCVVMLVLEKQKKLPNKPEDSNNGQVKVEDAGVVPVEEVKTLLVEDKELTKTSDNVDVKEDENSEQEIAFAE